MMRAGADIWRRWKALARRAARVQSNVILTVLYVVMFVPLAIVRRPFGNPIHDASHGWRMRDRVPHDLTSARRQF